MNVDRLCLAGFSLFFAVDCALAEDSSTLSTITVTAEKRAADVQKVTSSISVLSDLKIEDAQIESTREIQNYTPNLSTLYGGSRAYFSRINMRGMSNTGIGEPAVALYVDGVSYSDLFIFNVPLFDVERVEVLKGPQGSLYGKNTEAGVINVISKRPTNFHEADVKVSVGNFAKKRLVANLNLPIRKNQILSRFSLLASSQDGFLKNLFDGGRLGDKETLAGRGTVLFDVSERLKVTMTLEASQLVDDGVFPMIAEDKKRYGKVTGFTPKKFETAYDFIGDSRSKNFLGSVRIESDFDLFDLESITSYRHNDNQLTLDGDFTPEPNFIGFNERIMDAFSQELRFKSNEDQTSSQWLLGFYYGFEKTDQQTGYRLDKNYAEMMGVPLYSEDNMAADLEKVDASVFAQGTRRFFNDALGLTAGLRYEHSIRRMDRRHRFAGADVVPEMRGLEKSYNHFLPKISLDYLFSDDVMLYATLSQGYKSGGYSYAIDKQELAEFDPETSKALELGLKSDFPELGLRFNVAGFLTKVKDYQDRLQISATDIIQANASEVDIFGFEVESEYFLTDELSLSGAYGYTRAQYGQYIDPMSGANYEDNRVAGIPLYDLGLFMSYRHPQGFMARVEAHKMGSSYLDRDNTAKQDSYTFYNLKVGYETNSWDVHFAVKNLTNEEYLLDAFKDPALGYLGTFGDPRSFDVSVNLRF